MTDNRYESKKSYKFNKKAVLSQGNLAICRIYSFGVLLQHPLQVKL